MYQVEMLGKLTSLSYTPVLCRSNLKVYSFADFDINNAKSCGVININDVPIAYSKWVSPKRTRSYPYARIYDTYAYPKRITIIPVIKDEGKNGDCDRINMMTISLMSLLGIYVIYAWYNSASANKAGSKITNQGFDTFYINQKISEIAAEQLSALHWNINHFKRDFENVFQQAINSYEKLGNILAVALHSKETHEKAFEKFKINGKFDSSQFKDITLKRSFAAAKREIVVDHAFEHLTDGSKTLISIENYLGGIYYLTVDETYNESDKLMLQESKNSSMKLPKIADIKDGLLKLILYSNLENVLVNSEIYTPVARLKLTGNITGRLLLPAQQDEIELFSTQNQLTNTQQSLINLLNSETTSNHNLQILITGNQNEISI